MSTPILALAGLDETPAPAAGFERKVRARCRLALMVVLSLLGHAAMFYVFQVAYTPTGSLLPPPARVLLVPLDRPENASFARWLALSDPTLTIQPDNPSSADATAFGFPNVRYSPSYETMSPAFKPLDAGTAVEGIAAPPQPVVPGPVAMGNPLPGKTIAASFATSPSAAGTPRVALSDNLRTRVSLPLPLVQTAGGTALKSLEPSVFLVGLRPDGGEPFLFPIRQAPTNGGAASADEADEAAHAYLARLTFHPAVAPGDGITWGKATLYWVGGSFPNSP